MNNNYIPLVPGKSIKLIKKEDKKPQPEDIKMKKLFESLQNNRFQSWLDSPLKLKTISKNGKYRGTYFYDDEGDVVSKKIFVTNFIVRLKNIIEENGYSINNNKLFRDTVASYIYKLSN